MPMLPRPPERHMVGMQGSGMKLLGLGSVIEGPPLMPTAKMTASASSVLCLPILSTTLTAEMPVPAGLRTRSWAKVLPVMVPPLRLIRSARGSRIRSATLPLHQHTSKSAWCARAALQGVSRLTRLSRPGRGG